MKIYLAGPMRGYDRLNFPAFDRARDYLGYLGHDPVSPADMDREIGVDEHTTELPTGFVHDALKRDFAAILTCDAIALLPGWEASSGARAERTVAVSIGLPCYRVYPGAGAFYRESVIGIAGYARSGKDTLARHLCEWGFEQRSFAAPLKAILVALDPLVCFTAGVAGGRPLDDPVFVYDRLSRLVDAIGWDEAKKFDEVRSLLQRLGTEGGRAHLGENVWVDALFDAPSSGRLVVSDVRYPNEASAIRARGGLVVRVDRPGVRAVNGHLSERALDDFDFDLVVTNDGTVEDLKRAADDIAKAAWVE